MKVIRELSLLLAGGLIGIGAIPFGNQINKYLLLVIVLVVLLILIGVGLLGWLRILYLHCWLFVNTKVRKISFFAPYEIDSNNSSWVDVSLRQIFSETKKSKIKFNTIVRDKNFAKYPIIINPYGGVYPESNLYSLESLDKVFSYVRKGGIYIGIADIPFYYAYDANLQRRVDTTPMAGDFSQFRSFLQTILTKKLHCFVYALVGGSDFESGITRVIELTDNSVNLFDREISIDKSDKKYSPFLAIPYGRGYFVFSTITIDKTKIKHISKIIEKSLELLA